MIYIIILYIYMLLCLLIVGIYCGLIRLFIYLILVIYNVGKKLFDRIIELEVLINL